MKHSNPEINNPFESKASSQSYKHTDPVYEQSAHEAVDFAGHDCVKGLDKAVVVDLGGGTGVSTEIINNYYDNKELSIVEPSKAMLAEAESRLGHSIQYLNASAEELANHFDSNISLAFALNCLHLFPDLPAAAQSMSKALADDGYFIFNISRPSYHFEETTEAEKHCLKANLDFYIKLYEQNQESQILASTVVLLNNILEGQGELIHSRKRFQEVFSSVNMELVDYKEVMIKTEAIYQQNIWRMVAAGFTSDSELIESAISSIDLPEEVHIRQAFFKLCKKKNL